jgi:BirA family biotin operon repressor/biotin-[acetyl-CoA-carboxylase] ligase
MSVSWQIEIIDILPSTQVWACERAAAGAGEGVVIQALEQSRGRGRHGNLWASPIGNLYLSLILEPLCKPDVAGQLSFVIGLAVSAAIDPYMTGDHKKTLKWPNDILIDGKKCAGILLESDLNVDGLVNKLIVGIGVNLLSAPEGGIGVKDIAGDHRLAIHRFRDEVLAHINDGYQSWKKDGFESVRNDWLKQAHGLNHKMSARLADRTEKGIFRNIGPDGALMLESDGKQIAIRAGDVYFGT